MARRETDERRPEDDPTTVNRDDPYEETRDSRWYSPRGWWPPLGGRMTGLYGRSADVETNREVEAEREDGSWLGIGLSTAIIVVGVLLFLFPEPATSMVGLLLIGIGVLMWLFEMVTS